MTMAPSTAASAAEELLASLDPEQRAAATLPDGPAQVIAPVGSGKTMTLIARLGVLLGRGVAVDRIGVVTWETDYLGSSSQFMWPAGVIGMAAPVFSSNTPVGRRVHGPVSHR